MQATVHKIKSRRGTDIQLASLADFKLYDERNIDAAVLLHDSQLSLYCLDFVQGRAVFVRTPADTNVYAAPFMYQEQRRSAREVLTIPLAALMLLAERLPARFEKIAFVFSIGRCGSSVIARQLGGLAGVRTISEPDFLSQLVASPPAQLRDAELPSLVRACLPFCVPATDASDTHLVVKPRAYTMQLAPALWQAFPQMRAVLLYRDAEEAVASALRMLESSAGSWLPRGATALKLALSVQPKSERELMHRLVPVFNHIPVQTWSALGLSGLLLANWVSLLQTYGELRDRGLPIALVHYQDFVESPQRALTGLLTALTIPHASPPGIAPETWARMRSTNHDSAARLPDKERAKLREILRIVPLTDVPERHA